MWLVLLNDCCLCSLAVMTLHQIIIYYSKALLPLYTHAHTHSLSFPHGILISRLMKLLKSARKCAVFVSFIRVIVLAQKEESAKWIGDQCKRCFLLNCRFDWLCAIIRSLLNSVSRNFGNSYIHVHFITPLVSRIFEIDLLGFLMEQWLYVRGVTWS